VVRLSVKERVEVLRLYKQGLAIHQIAQGVHVRGRVPSTMLRVVIQMILLLPSGATVSS